MRSDPTTRRPVAITITMARRHDGTKDTLGWRDIETPVRDGAILHADLHVAAGDQRRPGLLIRTPYGRQQYREDSMVAQAVERGYAVVVQDVRGRYDSAGTFDPYRARGPRRLRHDRVDRGAAVVERPRGDRRPVVSGRRAVAGGRRDATSPDVRVPGHVLFVRAPVLLLRRRVRPVVAAVDGQQHRARRPAAPQRQRAANQPGRARVVARARPRRAAAGAASRSSAACRRHAVLRRVAGPSR